MTLVELNQTQNRREKPTSVSTCSSFDYLITRSTEAFFLKKSQNDSVPWRFHYRHKQRDHQVVQEHELFTMGKAKAVEFTWKALW